MARVTRVNLHDLEEEVEFFSSGLFLIEEYYGQELVKKYFSKGDVSLALKNTLNNFNSTRTFFGEDEMSFEAFFQILDEFCSGLLEEVQKITEIQQQQNKKVTSKQLVNKVVVKEEKEEEQFDELINALTKAHVFYSSFGNSNDEHKTLFKRKKIFNCHFLNNGNVGNKRERE